jgi:hypothetical protein
MSMDSTTPINSRSPRTWTWCKAVKRDRLNLYWVLKEPGRGQCGAGRTI